MEITVTIRNDDDGFYGSENHDNINHAASVENYEAEVIAAIRKTYSPEEVEINMEYAPYAGRSIIVSGEDRAECEYVEDVVSEAVERVYNFGSYWVEKNLAAVSLGRLGGSAKSTRKAISSAANGRKGGRPKMTHSAN